MKRPIIVPPAIEPQMLCPYRCELYPSAKSVGMKDRRSAKERARGATSIGINGRTLNRKMAEGRARR